MVEKAGDLAEVGVAGGSGVSSRGGVGSRSGVSNLSYSGGGVGDGTGDLSDLGDEGLFVDDSVETVDGVGRVFDGPPRAVGVGEGVAALDSVSGPDTKLSVNH